MVVRVARQREARVQPTKQFKGYAVLDLGFNNYHNQSSILLGDSKLDWKKEEIKQVDVKKKKDPVDNTKPVWNYNPKNAGKTTMILGD